MKPIRILIIEDNLQRERLLCSWLPLDIKPVVTRSAGRAMGTLARDKGNVYSGIILDHDLQERPATDADRLLSGQDIIDVISQCVSRDVPILVHSVNASQSWVMVVRLQHHGYEVTHIPMDLLTCEAFSKWIGEVRQACSED
jgi:hypothetical protein